MIKKIFSIITLVVFITTLIKSPSCAGEFVLPKPGVMIHLSPEFKPAQLMGMSIHPQDALQFDFLINKGDSQFTETQKKEEYSKLIKYFLASLTVPDEDQWVNLSPYEKQRIIKDNFGKTEMGRDLLAQDYLLKQITSSLIYPEDELGKKFWDKVYERAWKEYGTTNIPVNTFNKVWIMPDQAVVYESGQTVLILKNRLKVMLEEDYLSLDKHSGASIKAAEKDKTHALGSQIIKEIILPELEREVNEGENFANLRQIYSGMILATWYKKALKDSLLGQVYADKGKTNGVNQQDVQANETIYKQYLQAFKKGVFNYIKDDIDKYTKEEVPRKYFSGGILKTATGKGDMAMKIVRRDTEVLALDLNSLSGREDIFQELDRVATQITAKDAEVEISPKLFDLKPHQAATVKVLRGLNSVSIQSGNQKEGLVFQLMSGTSDRYIVLDEMNDIWDLQDGDVIESATGVSMYFKDQELIMINTNQTAVHLAVLPQDAFYMLPQKTIELDRRGKGSLGLIFFASIKGVDASGKEYSGVLSIKRINGVYQYKVLDGQLPNDHLFEITDDMDANKIRVTNISSDPIDVHFVKGLSFLKNIQPHRISMSVAAVLPAADSAKDSVEINIQQIKPTDEGRLIKSYKIPTFKLKIHRPTANGRYPVSIQLYHGNRINMYQFDLSEGVHKKSLPFSLELTIRNGVLRLKNVSNEFLLMWGDIKGNGQTVPLTSPNIGTAAESDANRFIEFISLHRPVTQSVTSTVEPSGSQADSPAIAPVVTKPRTASRFLNTARKAFAPIRLAVAALSAAIVPGQLWQHNGIVNNDIAAKNTISDGVLDRASLAEDPLGGIDLNSANLNLEIKRDGKGVPLPLSQQNIGQLMNIPGFEPVIIEIKPAVGLPILTEIQEQFKTASSSRVTAAI